MRNENELAKRIGQGDRKADEQFVDLFGARVHRLVRRYIAVEADAEDVTQEIFVDLFRGASGFRGESALGTWVYRVALNHCLRHRARTGAGTYATPEPLDEHDEVADTAPDPAGHALRGELSGQVQFAVEKLSAVQRDVIILHELHGLTYGECAKVLDVPVGTVKSRLSNAFRALRASLGGYVLDNAIADNTPENGARVAGGEAA